MKMYLRFGAMILTSTITMYCLTYANTYETGHVFFSEMRAYMAVIMGAAMAIVMLTFMRQMYKHTAINAAIYAGCVVLLAVALWLMRTQAAVDEVAYMRAMIPHHSIAILTSERATITDPRVRTLASEILAAQRREIQEMKALIADLESRR